jgi:phage terminase large subunit-like protein
MIDDTTNYADLVVKGKIKTGRLVRLVCERHLKDQYRKNFGYVYSIAAAADAISFFPNLKHYKGKQFAGKRFELELWQKFIIGCVFGWLNKETGLRRFNKAYVRIARKNGKTHLASGVGLMLLMEEPGAEVYAVATKKDQAMICFRDAAQFVNKNKNLSDMIAISGSMKKPTNLHIISRASKFEPLGRDSKTSDGLNPNGAVADEIHAHADRGIIEVVESGMGSREQPLFFMITTAGTFNREGICWELEQYSIQVLEDRFKDDAAQAFFPYIASLDEKDDWRDRKIWIKANPNLGVSVNEKSLEKECQLAESIPTKQNELRTKRFNQWVQQDKRWLNIEDWDKCGLNPLDVKSLYGRQCILGLDLAQVNDLSAASWLFLPIEKDPIYRVYTQFWCPEDDIQIRTKKHRVPYLKWQEDGYLFATPGNTTDFEFIEKGILDFAEKIDFQEGGHDRYFSQLIINHLQDHDLTMVPISQTKTFLSAPSKELERLIMRRGINHGNNPILNWNASNVTIVKDSNGNIKPDKEKSSEKIDGISALINALARAILHTVEDKTSMFADRGIEYIDLGGNE